MLSEKQESDLQETTGQVKNTYSMTHIRKPNVNLSAFRHHAMKTYMAVEMKLHTLTSEAAANIPNLHIPLGAYT